MADLTIFRGAWCVTTARTIRVCMLHGGTRGVRTYHGQAIRRDVARMLAWQCDPARPHLSDDLILPT